MSSIELAASPSGTGKKRRTAVVVRLPFSGCDTYRCVSSTVYRIKLATVREIRNPNGSYGKVLDRSGAGTIGHLFDEIMGLGMYNPTMQHVVVAPEITAR